MYNTYGARDCRKLLELVSKDRSPKLKDFALKITLDVWKKTRVRECIFYDEASQM